MKKNRIPKDKPRRRRRISRCSVCGKFAAWNALTEVSIGKKERKLVCDRCPARREVALRH